MSMSVPLHKSLKISAFSGENLEVKGLTNVTDLDAYVPNTVIQPLGAGWGATLAAYIRGVGLGDNILSFEPGVPIYVDDVYMGRPQGSIFDLLDLERVEVLRGPQGTLFGKNAVVDGYRGNSGLSLSTVDLVRSPAVADVEHLPGVIESEGRSHAFNSTLDADGAGVFGLPTVFKQASWSDYEETSNVHFFAVDRSLDIRPSGYLGANADAIDEDYECEVSCVDWYGNARPIFTEGRVFALMGTELVEGRLFNGGIAEIQRVGMTGAPRYRR